jgi:FkbM family methyltransferase
MNKFLIKTLKKWRENYYLSRVLTSTCKPLHAITLSFARHIETKLRRNGATIRLPNGKSMRIVKNAGVSMASTAYWRGVDGIEPETSHVLQYFLNTSKVFVDVGANYGFYSMLAALSNPSLKVIAFEPVAPIYEGLRKNIDANALGAQVICENLALSSRSGSATLYLPRSEDADIESTGTLSASGWQVRQNAQPLEIQAIRFDEYALARSLRADLIKIDVEDFEADVLEGMSDVIRRDRPFLICEILPRNSEHKNERTRQILSRLGYSAYWITPCGLVRVTRFDFERAYTNFLLSPITVPAEVLEDPSMLWRERQSQLNASVA